MLITRLNATLQSFSWSDRAKRMPRHVAEAVSRSSFNQSKFSHITVADALASRKDLLSLKKISSDPPDTRSSNPLTKVKVGRVPDRGGRPSEMAAPPPEMPSWQQRSGQTHNAQNFNKGQGGRQGGYQGGGGGYHGGGRNQDRGYQRDDRGGHRDERGYQGKNDRNSQGRDDGGYQGGGGGHYQGGGRNKNRGVQGAGWKKN